MADDTTNLLALLQKIAAEQNYTNPDIQLDPVSTSGANYSSKLYHIKITSDGKQDLRLFAKIAAIHEHMRSQLAFEVYINERFVYCELMKAYKELEEKCRLSKEHRLVVPKFYGADPTYLQEIVVLEDLACMGFMPHSRFEPVSWEYAAAAVTELTKFHAHSFALKKNDPAAFDKVANTCGKGLFTENESVNTFCSSSVKTALKWVREENKEKLQKFVNKTNLADFGEPYRALRRPVIIHADFRPSNMLHRRQIGGPLEVILVDYQTIQVGCSVVDLLYFIFLATDGSFRARHFQELMNYYHSELGAALARLGLAVDDCYPREDFEFELKEKLSYGLQLSVLFLPTLLMEETEAPPVGEDFSMDALIGVRVGDSYVKRLNEAVDDYVTWGVLV